MRHALLALLLALTPPYVMAADPATRPQEDTKTVHGELLSVEGDTLAIRPGPQRAGDAPNDPVSVVTDQHTRVRVDGAAASIAELMPGMTIEYEQVPARDERPARAAIWANSPGVEGKVVQRTWNAMQFRVSPGDDRTIQTDDKTRVVVLGPRREGDRRRWSLADVKSGMRVRIVAAEGPPGVLTARVIYLPPVNEPASQPSR